MSLQDPEFDKFKQAYQEGNFNYALHSLKKLLASYPHSFALHWHQAKVLEKLERFSEARRAIDKVLSMRAEFIPALILQVQLDFHERNDEDDSENADYDDEPRLSEHARFNLIEQRLYKILSIDPNAVDALHMLSGLLRGHEGDAHVTKANQLLNRAISLAPARVDLLEDRGNSLLGSAIVQEGDTTTSINIVSTFSGMRYKRDQMELALSDFHSCYQLTGEHRFGLRVASILHDLGRFDEALAAYDKVLANVAIDDPYRSIILERRSRSENDGGGERERMAKMLESTIAMDGKDRTLEEDNVAQAMLGAAQAVRAGKSVSEALEHRISDDPVESTVTKIATQIINLVHEPKPELTAVNPKDFPAYQQKFLANCKRDLAALGLLHIGDAEAEGLRLMLGKRVMMSFFADDTGDTGVSCFCMRPKQINFPTRLKLFFTGKWKLLASFSKENKMVECLSQFVNGDYLSTQFASISPFEYGAPLYIEKLATESATEVVLRHRERLAQYKDDHPRAIPIQSLDLEGMEKRWVKGQASKSAYRKQINYVTDKELRGLLGIQYDRYADKIRAKIEVLAADL